jgi:hypothetical protein
MMSNVCITNQQFLNNMKVLNFIFLLAFFTLCCLAAEISAKIRIFSTSGKYIVWGYNIFSVSFVKNHWNMSAEDSV